MKTNADDSEGWLRSGEARKVLRVSTCQLMHLREAGEIRFRKSGNAYLYSANDCQRIAIVRSGREADETCPVDGIG